MKPHPAWAVYRGAWAALLPGLRFLHALDRISGKRILPRHWRLGERLGREGTSRAGAARGGPVLWLHCASLGEAKGLWALARGLPPEAAAVLTANTWTGMEFLEKQLRGMDGAGRSSPALKACMAPLDHPALVGDFLDRQGIAALCLYEAELWPHYLRACRDRGLPVALVSARLTPKARRLYGRVSAAASLLRGLDWIQAQGEGQARDFRALTPVPVEEGCDFKAAYFLGPGPRFDARPDGPAESRFAFLSLHAAELRRFRPALPGLMRRFGVTVFPRHLRELPVFLAALEELGFSRHSENPGARHLLVDSLGQVEALLPHCHSAFVGGSLVDAGCHNLWEPLAAGLKIYFGARYHNQAGLAEELLRLGLAEVAGPEAATDWRAPGPEIRAQCRGLAESHRLRVERALGKFYLFSQESMKGRGRR